MLKKLWRRIRKEAGLPEETYVPAQWKEIDVHPDNCAVTASSGLLDTPDTPATLDNRRPYSQPVQMSYIQCKATVGGKPYRFVSEALRIDPKALHMHLLRQQHVRIWYDPSQPASHRFDLSFLSAE